MGDKMKKPITVILLIIITHSMMTSCFRDNDVSLQDMIDRDNIERPVQNTPGQGNTGVDRPPDGNTSDVSDTEQYSENALRILAPRPPEYIAQINADFGSIYLYIQRFKRENPEVEVVIEYYAEDWSQTGIGIFSPTMPQLMALTTKLLADPPDLFIFDADTLVFEKINPEAIFVDLNHFIDGLRGLNRDDFFDNIFRAIEQNDSLYSITSQVTLEMILLNRDLFSLIGVDADKIDAVSMGELLEYYKRISLVYDDTNKPLEMHYSFKFPEVLLHEALYNIEEGTVSANTLEMRERLEQALSIPMEEYFDRRFTPEIYIHGLGMGVDLPLDRNWQLADHYIMFRGIRSTRDVITFFLQHTPKMRFTTPVKLLNDNGDISFKTGRDSFSIMRQSRNQDLAWEFIKFVMEIEDGSRWNGYTSWWEMPVNRTRFDHRFEILVPLFWENTEYFEQISRYMDDFQGSMDNEIAIAKEFFIEAMEQLNHQSSLNWAVYMSLIHPDLWMLYTGQQDVARTLANIQNRLELYVSE